jgi:tRNA 2-thiouridine synthesizing protein A
MRPSAGTQLVRGEEDSNPLRRMIMTEITPHQTVDFSGLSCPMPIIKTKKAIDGMAVGEILKMISTDPGSVSDMQAWAQKTGQTLLSHEENGGKYIFFIKKTK